MTRRIFNWRRVGICCCRGGIRAARAAAVAAMIMMAMAVAPRSVLAQQGHKHKPAPTPRGAVSIDIRAQVPVPQVVTVRPRAIPAFRADALDTVFVDEHRWSALRVPYQAVPMVAFPESNATLLSRSLLSHPSLSSPPTDSLKER